MSLASSAAAYYALIAALSERSRKRARAIWAELDRQQVTASWDAVARDALLTEVSVAQRMAAVAASRFMGNALNEQGADWIGELVNPLALSGVASDGRDLDSLLFQPAISTMRRLKDFVQVDEAFAMGAAELDAIVGTQVTDASRAAMQVEMASQPAVTGYVRMLTPPSCGRCAILAGRFYRFSDGFLRHPNCDCVHIPSAEDAADDLRTDPTTYFDSLTTTEQDKYFGKGSAEAIRQGANMNQVVNARRKSAGMSRVGAIETTSESTTRRGVAAGSSPRLTPDAILRLADGDKAKAAELFRRYAYVL